MELKSGIKYHYNGIKIWNKIPFAIKSVDNITIFKNKYKKFLLDNMTV